MSYVFEGTKVQGLEAVEVDLAPYSETTYNAMFDGILVVSVKFDFDDENPILTVSSVDRAAMQDILESGAVTNELHALGLIITQCGMLAFERCE